MECEHVKITRAQFNEKVQFYANRKEFLFFLLNTINLILHNGWQYCYCDKYEKRKRPEEINCKLCRIAIIFVDFEKDIYKDMFNDTFLWKYHSKLIFHLCQIFETEKAASCYFLDDEFHYRGRDRVTVKTWNISQKEALEHGVKLKFEELKKARKNRLPENRNIRSKETVKDPRGIKTETILS